MQWSGNIVSNLQGRTSFLIDADLSPDIAEALKRFDFDVIHTTQVPEFQDHLDHLYDPEIITWCNRNSRTWLTHDFDARRKHQEAMKVARIHVVWVRITTKSNEKIPGESATWRIFKVIVRTIDEIGRRIRTSHGAIHFRINLGSRTSPTIDWTESNFDKPKGK